MLFTGMVAVWLRYKQRLYTSRSFLWFALLMGPSGLIAILAGWVTTEVGRQPRSSMGYSVRRMRFPHMAICT